MNQVQFKNFIVVDSVAVRLDNGPNEKWRSENIKFK